MRVFMKRVAAICLTMGLLLSLCGCWSEPTFSMDDFEEHRDTAVVSHTFAAQDNSGTAVYDEAALTQLQSTIKAQTVIYPYAELFNYEEAMSGVHSGVTVDKHAYSVLDANGEWTKEHFVQLVQSNSAAYLDTLHTSVVQPVDDEILRRICEILMEAITAVLDAYPDIDRNRVYCNLGNLKIIKKTSALDFAAVEPGMILHVNPSTSSMVDLMTTSNMYSVIMHEAMHIVQYGCTCEPLDGCERRCGLAYSYSARKQDYSDWIWFAEASAERMTCLLSNVEPMTYQHMVNYLVTMELAVVLRDDVYTNYMGTVNFHNDLNRLFDPFEADTDDEKREIYQMIYALEIMQMYPDDVQEAYTEIYGEEFTTEVHDRICIAIKRPIVQTLTKQFYSNLIEAVKANTLTCHDVLFLLNLYDSTINFHLGFDEEKYNEANTEFAAWYSDVQAGFFAAFDNLSLEEYEAYRAVEQDTKTVQAGMTWLDKEKGAFLLEKVEDHLCDYKFIGQTTE